MKSEDNDLEMIDMDKIDVDIEEKEEVISTDGSILTDEYQSIEPLQSDKVDEDEDEKSIELKYSFNGTDVIEGLTTIQAVLHYKKNMVYTVFLFILFLVYMLDFTNMQSQILGFISLGVIGIIWLMPKVHINRFAKKADEKDIKLSMNIYANYIKVTNSNNDETTLSFNGQISNIIETESLFVLCAGKERVFIVPKRCIAENIHEYVREIFSIAMGDNFHQKNIVI